MKKAGKTMRCGLWIFGLLALPWVSGVSGAQSGEEVLTLATTNAITRPGVLLEEFVFETAPFPSCHSATLLELPDGELLCAFFGGTRERHPDVEIWLARKPAGGAWTPPVSIADGVQSGDERLPTWNPVLYQPEGGELTLYYKVGPSPSEWWGMVKTSGDGGRTWSEGRKLGEGLIGPVKNKPIRLADGTILAGSSTEGGGWRVHTERSRDGGKSWELMPPVNPDLEIGAIQPTVLTYADGRIQMMCRTRSEHGFAAQTWSRDGGLTWSPLEASVLPNNNSGFDGVTLRDGRQLLVYNHSTREQEGMGHKGRGILNVALSNDGVTWEAALVLDHTSVAGGRQFSYPAVIQTRDGRVHIAYTWHRDRIKHVVLDPAKLESVPMKNGQWPSDGPFSLAAFKNPAIVIEAESLRLERAQARDMEGASGRVVSFNAEGDRAAGEVKLPRDVYEVRLELVSNSEHSDAVNMSMGAHHWRAFTWTYGQLTISKPYILTLLEEQTLPLSIEYAEPEILVDRVVIQPLLGGAAIKALEAAAGQNPDLRAADVVLEAESMNLTGCEMREFEGASGRVVAFDGEGAQARSEVMLEPGVYEVTLDMVSHNEQSDGINVDIGETQYRTASWSYGRVGQSNPIVVTIPSKSTYPVVIRYGEPGVLVDRIQIKPLMNAAVLAGVNASGNR